MIFDQNFYRFVIVTPTRITVCAGYLLAIHIRTIKSGAFKDLYIQATLPILRPVKK